MKQTDSSIRMAMVNNTTRISLQGALHGDLAANLSAIVSKVTLPVHIDLAYTPFVTASGLTSLLSFYQHHQQKPVLLHASKDIKALLRLSGISDYVTFADETKEITTQDTAI